MESVYTIDGVNAQLNSFLTRLTLQQWQQKKNYAKSNRIILFSVIDV